MKIIPNSPVRIGNIYPISNGFGGWYVEYIYKKMIFLAVYDNKGEFDGWSVKHINTIIPAIIKPYPFINL